LSKHPDPQHDSSGQAGALIDKIEGMLAAWDAEGAPESFKSYRELATEIASLFDPPTKLQNAIGVE
jgi:hypothetical protein